MPTFRTSVQITQTDLGLPNVILVGLPGAGKTTVGRAVAEKLGRTFLDFDEEIERREHMKISEIFGSRGEPAFRTMEKRLTQEVAKTTGMIVSPGGGWIANPGVVEIVKPPAQLLYLKLRPETAIQRLGEGRLSRPLLKRPDPLGEMKKLLADRQAAYESSDFTVSTEVMPLQRVVESIVELVALK